MSDMFKNSASVRLFRKRPSFVDGMASLIERSPNIHRYNVDDTENEADAKSLSADWYAIGEDLWNAIKDYGYQGKQFKTA